MLARQTVFGDLALLKKRESILASADEVLNVVDGSLLRRHHENGASLGFPGEARRVVEWQIR